MKGYSMQENSNIVQNISTLFEKIPPVIIKYARAWNNLDFSLVSDYFTENIIHESQLVLVPISGKAQVIKFLNNKVQLIKKDLDEYKPSAELAFCGDKACLVMRQGHKTKTEGVVFLEIEENLIKRIDMCVVPFVSETILSGICPI